MKNFLFIVSIFYASLCYSYVVVDKIKGDASFYDNENKKIKINPGDKIEDGYSVITDSNSEVEMVIEDIGMVVLYGNSKFVVNGGRSDSKSFSSGIVRNLYADGFSSIIDYFYGKATFFIKKLSREYVVSTPYAVIGVRGTSFSLNLNEESKEIGLFKGMVEVKKGSEVKILKPGQSAYILDREIKISNRLSSIMEKEKKRAIKLEKYFQEREKKIRQREETIRKKLDKRQ